MLDHITNLVFEGGGIKGLAYIGVIKELETSNVLPHIKRYGGSSAGAIIALMLALNYNYNEVNDMFEQLDILKFKDDSNGVLRDISRLMNDYGWLKGRFLKEWIEEIIAKKTNNKDVTFKELHDNYSNENFKDLYILGTNLTTHSTVIFCKDKTENYKIADAVRLSCSIPIVFPPVEINNDLYVDGGVLINFPIKLFDRKIFISEEKNAFVTEEYETLNEIESFTDPYVYNKETLGFKLDIAAHTNSLSINRNIKKYQIFDLLDYLKELAGTVMDSQDNQLIHENDILRTVLVDSLGISAIQFDITKEEKSKLIQSGIDSTRRFLDNYIMPEIQF
ncbi:patatin-like phospholipase family protein [Lacrimispora sp. 38-1]|uniref:patatin-like phospholipase family protein n=1 Tax=Lacrimispora sp. 38-1 TaxID=3125778 RepID=UPI003CED54F2